MFKQLKERIPGSRDRVLVIFVLLGIFAWYCVEITTLTVLYKDDRADPPVRHSFSSPKQRSTSAIACATFVSPPGSTLSGFLASQSTISLPNGSSVNEVSIDPDLSSQSQRVLFDLFTEFNTTVLSDVSSHRSTNIYMSDTRVSPKQRYSNTTRKCIQLNPHGRWSTRSGDDSVFFNMVVISRKDAGKCKFWVRCFVSLCSVSFYRIRNRLFSSLMIRLHTLLVPCFVLVFPCSLSHTFFHFFFFRVSSPFRLRSLFFCLLIFYSSFQRYRIRSSDLRTIA